MSCSICNHPVKPAMLLSRGLSFYLLLIMSALVTFGIAVLCSYIKRRKHLTLLTDRDIKIAATELLRAFNESLQTLKLLGVRNSLYVDESLSMLSSKTATAVFDFYESVIEADILNLTGIQVSLIKANGLRLSLNVCCKADLSALVSGDGIRYEKEDDEEYQRLVFEAKEGDRK